MKILMVSPVPTDPVDAGNRARIVSLADTLTQAGHELHYAFVPLERCDQVAMARRFGAKHLHLLSWAKRGGAAEVVKRIARKLGRLVKLDMGYALKLDDWYDLRTTRELQQLQAIHRFDAVFVEYVFMSKAFESFGPSCLKVLDTHDCFGMRHRHYLAAGMRPQWFSTTLEAEETGFKRADFVLAIQSSEAHSFAARLSGTATKVLQVGHLVTLATPPENSSREAAIFVGSSNALNVAGARYFIEQVLPIVRVARPAFELLLAGAVSGEVEAAPGVVKLGFVPALQEAFGAAMISVNPMRAGTGLNIKLLDAMAAGMPIVTTASGARGVEELDGQAFVVVRDDDAEGFAAQLIRLIEDPRARGLLAAGARAAAGAWNAAQVDTLLDALTGPSARQKPQQTVLANRSCATVESTCLTGVRQ
jgi:glycosyltransferase involved in cell wall biosynthesis